MPDQRALFSPCVIYQQKLIYSVAILWEDESTTVSKHIGQAAAADDL
ncbi:hypothetical protein [Photorhabdus noenieputensis]|nr:hypothetical protein [Photorhabdus noenieputensis]